MYYRVEPPQLTFWSCLFLNVLLAMRADNSENSITSLIAPSFQAAIS